MAASEPGRRRWFALLVIIFLVFTGIFWPLLDNKKPVPSSVKTAHPAVEIVSWNWKKDRTGNIFAVYGQVRNLTGKTIEQVVLELRTVDGEEQVIARHPIAVADLLPGQEKPFRKDLPRTSEETMGYLEVHKVVP